MTLLNIKFVTSSALGMLWAERDAVLLCRRHGHMPSQRATCCSQLTTQRGLVAAREQLGEAIAKRDLGARRHAVPHLGDVG